MKNLAVDGAGPRSLTFTARIVPVTRPRTVNSRASTLPTTVTPAAIVRSVPRNSPSMLQKISHGPSQTILPMIGASARNE
jgi:hypothetical protein